MRRPIDAYREGYDKAKSADAGGALAELTMGGLRDDPGGHFAAGYRDGAAGKAYTPPTDNVRKEAAELNPFDDEVAIKTVCPNCGALDWFEWKVLGKLTDPVCGHIRRWTSRKSRPCQSWKSRPRTPSCGCGQPMLTCESPSMSSRPGVSSTELCLHG